MEKTVIRTTAATIAASLMLSGTCLAAPALAWAAPGALASIAGATADAEATPEEQATATVANEAPAAEANTKAQPSDGKTVALGKLQLIVPNSYELLSLDETMTMAYSPEGSVVVTITPLELGDEGMATLLGSPDGAVTLFDEITNSLAADSSDLESGETVELGASEVSALPTGEPVYAYLFSDETADTLTLLAQYYVVFEDDVMLVQIVVDVTDGYSDEMGDELSAIENSFSRVGAEPANTTAATPAGSSVTHCGITFTVADTLAFDDSDPESPMWYDENGGAILSLVADTTEGDDLDASLYGLLADGIIADLDGELVETVDFVTDNGVEMTLYSFAVADEDSQIGIQGVLTFIEIAPGNVTTVFAMATPDTSDEVIDGFNETFYSIALA